MTADFLRLGFAVHPLYVRCGLRWEAAELRRLRRMLKAAAHPRLRPLEVSRAAVSGFLGKRHWSLSGKAVPGRRSAASSVFLPGRNLVLLAQAGLYCAARSIPAAAIGILKGNPFPDARPAFLRSMEHAIASAFGMPFKVLAPYRTLSKREILRRFPMPSWLGLAFSCLAPVRGRPCGRCNKCAERTSVLP